MANSNNEENNNVWKVMKMTIMKSNENENNVKVMKIII